ncbi:Hsp70 family protein [Lusitaniella coriacea LEGE 07157]|uniref:Hsp70 family protein n=1 Tax=Lusitaniella coriacea LEGE 07157 TaxID=945747 RepID=A0A8J7DYI3_9CYAN|nr:Hsp70 family protein [Lusitaniella coriacea]MBE9116036.1 Hsp70 family protein [Lusitaniella coriacea LEGE 07157]
MVKSAATTSYAIDFGTSNTLITRWNALTQQPETVSLSGLSQQLADNPPLIPSLVYVEDARQGKIIVGQAVRDRGLDIANDPRFFSSFKRGIGTAMQGFLPELDGITVTFEQVGQWFLQTAIAQLQAETNDSLDSLILTVPVDSFEAYRNWLSGVARDLSVERVRMLDEPTAAALGYDATDGDLLLVVDFGGGTLDLSLVRLDLGRGKKPQGFILKWGEKSFGKDSAQKMKTARVLAKAGQNLGGADIDNWLVDYFSETQGLPKSSLIARLAERLKIQLSVQPQASEAYFNDETFESYQLSLDRATFETLLKERNFFQQLDDLMVQVLQRGRLQGIEATDIDAVLLVGGTVRIPAVRTWVEQYFDREKIRCDSPFEAIARGALQLSQGFELKDFLYHSYGIRYWNRRENRHDWHSLIKAGQPYPTADPVELTLGASVENQPRIELIIGELGAETGGTEVYFDGDRLVTRSLDATETSVQTLNDSDGARTLAKLDPPGNPGRDRVKLRFRVDEQRFLRLTVEDILANQILLDNQFVAQLR